MRKLILALATLGALGGNAAMANADVVTTRETVAAMATGETAAPEPESIIEVALMFFASQVLDSAVEDASRKVRTGQAQAASWTISNFRTEMCGYTFNLFGDCSGIKIKVSVLSNFASASTVPTVQNCTSTTCTWDPAFESYNAGIRRQVIQVQAFYRWPLLVVLPYFNLKDQPDNYRLLSAMRVFRNEPF